ncbi:MAG: thioredoxin domain-containing protein [Candidatus Woesearchaeota archaeon]
MVLCLLALPLFAILAIFSVRYRRLTLDALDCLLRTVTLRKCTSGLDDRIKADLTGRVLKLSPKTAGFFYRHYKIISWVVLLIFLWSTYQSSVSIYNYALYGDCNGPEETGFCLFDPSGGHISECTIDGENVDGVLPSEITWPVLEDEDPIISYENAIDGAGEDKIEDIENVKLTIIEFGCYTCEYTGKAEPVIYEVLEHYKGKVNIQFKSFHLPSHKLSFKASMAADCALDQGKYYEYHKELFLQQTELNDESFINIAKELGMDLDEFSECMKSEKHKAEVNSDSLMGLHAGVQGTPTFFVGEQKIVGPKPFKTFKKVIDEELKKIQNVI